MPIAVPQTVEQLPEQKVLVVEDDYWTRFLLHDLLEAHGFLALEASNAEEAFAQACLHKPVLILLDIQLAGTSGLEVVAQLRRISELRETPVVAVTAQTLDGDEERIREGGCIDYIAKPFSSATLIETVRRYTLAGKSLSYG